MIIKLANGKPEKIEATYTTWLEYDLESLDIDWSKVVGITTKYTILYITMEDGTVRELEHSHEGESDYKYPISLQMFNEKYDLLWEEGE